MDLNARGERGATGILTTKRNQGKCFTQTYVIIINQHQYILMFCINMKLEGQKISKSETLKAHIFNAQNFM
jgi:hypothetical protein